MIVPKQTNSLRAIRNLSVVLKTAGIFVSISVCKPIFGVMCKFSV